MSFWEFFLVVVMDLYSLPCTHTLSESHTYLQPWSVEKVTEAHGVSPLSSPAKAVLFFDNFVREAAMQVHHWDSPWRKYQPFVCKECSWLTDSSCSAFKHLSQLCSQVYDLINAHQPMTEHGGSTRVCPLYHHMGLSWWATFSPELSMGWAKTLSNLHPGLRLSLSNPASSPFYLLQALSSNKPTAPLIPFKSLFQDDALTQ